MVKDQLSFQKKDIKFLSIFKLFAFKLFVCSFVFLTEVSAKEPCQKNAVDTNGKLLEIQQSLEKAVGDSETLSDEELRNYLANEYDEEVSELKKATGCMMKENPGTYKWEPKASGTLVQFENFTRPLLLTNAHVFVDDKGEFREGEYIFSLNCEGPQKKISSMIHLDRDYLREVYEKIGLLGNLGSIENKNSKKDYAFMPLKEDIPRTAKALKMEAVENVSDFPEKIYMSGLIKNPRKELKQKIITKCYFDSIIDPSYNVKEGSKVRHNCPTTHGTSGTVLVSSKKEGLKIKGLHYGFEINSNGEFGGYNRALVFSSDFIEAMSEKVKKLEPCYKNMSTIVGYRKCLEKQFNISLN